MLYVFVTKSGKRISCGREPFYGGPIWVLRLLGSLHPEYLIGRTKLKYILKDILYYKNNY